MGDLSRILKQLRCYPLIMLVVGAPVSVLASSPLDDYYKQQSSGSAPSAQQPVAPVDNDQYYTAPGQYNDRYYSAPGQYTPPVGRGKHVGCAGISDSPACI